MLKRSLILFGVLVFFTGVFAQTLDDAGTRYNEGNQNYNAKEYAQAIKAYKSALEIATQVGPEADELKSSIQKQLGNAYYKNGIALYKTKDMDASLVMLEKGYAFVTETGNNKSKKKFVNVIAQVRSKKGDALRKENKLDEAFAEYQLGLEIKPTCVKAFYGQGLVYKEKGDMENMMERMDQVIKNGEGDSKAAKTVSAAKASAARALLAKAAEEFNAQKFDQAGKYIGLATNYKPFDEGTMEVFNQFAEQVKDVAEMADAMNTAKETLN